MTGSFSVVRDFYGYRTGSYGHKPINIDLTTSSVAAEAIASDDPGRLSLRRQCELLETRFVDLDIIRVGGDDFNEVENIEIDVAVQVTRELYDGLDIGIGRVKWSFITVAQAGSYMSLDSPCETEDLIDDWSAFGGGVDCFFVRSITYGSGGGTPTKGDGLAVSLLGHWGSGIGLAHELGHFLGVEYHLGSRSFLMTFQFPKPPYKWRPEEISLIKSSDSMHGGCP